ncbi:MAG: universal stress protein [Gammaproteobacteria bacterium]|nr:universal stress protein [Gammaproteobacteria bacterium]MBU0770185.1 universal stress protein [Gammaproteobacteria bacterium]MBU0855237.1 universal stress protein [Gammaproteobacteria bacterium]MBU1847427.1 universal stress protein [Gammaproteobacteria bacterium]
MRILLAVDGSDHGLRATTEVLRLASLLKTPPEVHLLFVHAPVPGGLLQQHVSREALNDYYREEGEDATRSALETLRAAQFEPVLHLHVGPPAETVARYAEQHDCSMIVMGRRGHGALASFALGSVASGVLHHSNRPVLLVK